MSDAPFGGYDGPDTLTERRLRIRVERNNMLDCRDPDHDSSICPVCSPAPADNPDDETEE
jgi:hypothetical protein